MVCSYEKDGRGETTKENVQMENPPGGKKRGRHKKIRRRKTF